MPTLSDDAIASLIEPYLPHATDTLVQQLSLYLHLLVKWNGRTNMTAIREPEEIVRRHFGESLFAAQHLPEAATLLDFGSGAGFPGLPIQLLYPQLNVTLGESQNKKASFLREAVRTLDLPTNVWADRIEMMPADRSFDVVTLRAVDKMPAALTTAAVKAKTHLVILSTGRQVIKFPEPFELQQSVVVPESEDQVLLIAAKMFHVEH